MYSLQNILLQHLLFTLKYWQNHNSHNTGNSAFRGSARYVRLEQSGYCLSLASPKSFPSDNFPAPFQTSILELASITTLAVKTRSQSFTCQIFV